MRQLRGKLAAYVIISGNIKVGRKIIELRHDASLLDYENKHASSRAMRSRIYCLRLSAREGVD
jgi:hypothetical protein